MSCCFIFGTRPRAHDELAGGGNKHQGYSRTGKLNKYRHQKVHFIFDA